MLLPPSYRAVYPDLARVFYSNMEIDKGVLTSNVKGTPTSLTVKGFGEAVGIPHEGAGIRINVNANRPGYNKTEFYYGIARISE
ncbi:hypothetical protein KIW84_057201 [Lathyrus oleraceus]|uniref:Uncharacterized protein n=1 Tax=Pisum sativum TaxID=3888 RepID=A0A9D4X592_PEA|nr:hypothetical protein KIW84_057201 [Pisum sativum]